jgi:hypothetical protein
MSAIPQAITPNPHTNLLNVYIQIANKMGFQQKNLHVCNTTYMLLGNNCTSTPQGAMLPPKLSFKLQQFL